MALQINCIGLRSFGKEGAELLESMGSVGGKKKALHQNFPRDLQKKTLKA